MQTMSPPDGGSGILKKECLFVFDTSVDVAVIVLRMPQLQSNQKRMKKKKKK